MGYEEDQNKPRSIFELNYFPSDEETQRWLNLIPFDKIGVLHLPSHNVIDQEIRRLFNLFREERFMRGDLLLSYHRLIQSAQSSDIVCGKTTSSGNTCGGIMDEEVSAFGIYYVCRLDNNHRYLK